jgi:hypothetical protein
MQRQISHLFVTFPTKLSFKWLFWEKVRTTKIRTSKFKKNIKNISKHQNIESVFLVHHYYYNQNIASVFLVHHYYDNQNIKKNIEIDFRCSDFTYCVKKDQNVKNRNINYLWRITYGYQGLWGPGGLG